MEKLWKISSYFSTLDFEQDDIKQIKAKRVYSREIKSTLFALPSLYFFFWQLTLNDPNLFCCPVIKPYSKMVVSVYSVVVSNLQHRRNLLCHIWNRRPETHHPTECVRTNNRFSKNVENCLLIVCLRIVHNYRQIFLWLFDPLLHAKRKFFMWRRNSSLFSFP